MVIIWLPSLLRILRVEFLVLSSNPCVYAEESRIGVSKSEPSYIVSLFALHERYKESGFNFQSIWTLNIYHFQKNMKLNHLHGINYSIFQYPYQLNEILSQILIDFD